MGLDLAMLPFDYDGAEFPFSHTVLDCQREGELFEALMKLPNEVVPEHFTSYLCRDEDFEELHYGKTRKTPYGEPLTYVRVKQLLMFSSHECVQNNHKNRAIWAYLAQMPKETKVALFWH